MRKLLARRDRYRHPEAAPLLVPLAAQADAEALIAGRRSIWAAWSGCCGRLPQPPGKKCGWPLILPAMGSHGGGTAEGQIEVLEHLGQNAETLGAPIHDRMEPVKIGEAEGCPVYADRAVLGANHIVIVNRVREHTEFIGEVAQLPGATEDALGFHSRMTEAVAAGDADRAEREMVKHLFDVVRRIEANLKIDLQQSTLCGFNFIHRKP